MDVVRPTSRRERNDNGLQVFTTIPRKLISSCGVAAILGRVPENMQSTVITLPVAVPYPVIDTCWYHQVRRVHGNQAHQLRAFTRRKRAAKP